MKYGLQGSDESVEKTHIEKLNSRQVWLTNILTVCIRWPPLFGPVPLQNSNEKISNEIVIASALLSYAPPQVEPTPFALRVGSWLNARGLRGSHRLRSLARLLGQLNRVVQYPLPRNVHIDVPLYRFENCWTARELNEYEPELINALAESAENATGPVRLIDCGADIGTISTVLFSRCPNLSDIIAFEPNLEACVFARRNIGRLPVSTEVFDLAVSDFEGHGRLECPEYDDSPHTMYLVPATDGEIAVTTIDALQLAPEGTLLIKIDTEGAEQTVIRGAYATISRAQQVVLAFEAHPSVAARTGIDSTEILCELNQLRPFHSHIAEFPDLSIDLTEPLFEQVRLDSPYGLNIVCESK